MVPTSSEPELPLPDALKLPELNAHWPVYSGLTQLDSETSPRAIQVLARWLPRPDLAWHADAPDSDSTETDSGQGSRRATGPVVLTLLDTPPGGAEARGAFITRSALLEGYLDGVATVVELGDAGADLQRVDFLLLNVPAPHDASGLASPGKAWAGRLRLTFGPWSVLLDAPPNAWTRQQEAAAAAGFLASHAGRLTRSDRGTFSPTSAQDALHGLGLALSFALARWVAAERLRGYDRQDQLVWQQWASRRIEPWEPARLSWWNGQRADDLTAYVDRFGRIYADPKVGPVLQRVTHYAIAASAATSVAVEASLQLAQSGLELLAWSTLRRTMSGKAYDALHFDGVLRALLRRASISPDVPASLPSLHSYQQIRQAANPALDPNQNAQRKGDAPEILNQIRNDLTHPKLDSPNPEVYAVPGAIADAWRLSLQYLDLLILHWTGYDGPYSSRLPDQSWRGDVRPVPWQPHLQL